MAQDAKTLIKFNIKNAAYALLKGTGFEPKTSFGYSDSISLEADYSEKVIYGDGRKIYTIPNDKGKTGSLALLTLDEAYEIAMGRRMKTAKGTAEIKQTSSVEHAIYFEFDYIDEEGIQKTGKTILYGVTTGRASETYNQTTDDINNNNISYPLTIKGAPLKTSSGEIYKDDKGNEIYVWQETCIPGDPGYGDFGTNISYPTVSTSTTGLDV